MLILIHQMIQVQAVDRSYILTQGPLPSTVSHFWSMAWEQNCRVIVMLNNTIEKNQVTISIAKLYVPLYVLYTTTHFGIG